MAMQMGCLVGHVVAVFTVKKVEIRSTKHIDHRICRAINRDKKGNKLWTSDSWLEGKTSSELKEDQDADSCIGVIKTWLQDSSERPKWKAISHLSNNIKLKKYYWSQWDQLVIQNGILYRKWWQSGRKDPINQMVASMALRELIIQQLHNKQGHLGIKRIIASLWQQFYCTGYIDDPVAW